ncbi:MAG: metallophosphoesterase [Deltaproteobacteria bacterium]|nr:MAG: metallophosphoesterase [Deltaproteobacteria bacterium]
MKFPLSALIAFLALFLGLAGGVGLLLDWRLVLALQLARPWSTVGHALVGGLVGLIFGGMLLHRLLRPGPVSDGLAWAAFVAMGLLAVILPLTVIRDLLLWVWGIVAGGAALAGAGGPVSTEHLRAATAGMLAIAVGLVGVGLVNARRVPSLRRVAVPIAGLPPALHGLRIVQLSDLHVGPTIGADFLRAVVDRVRSIRPDLVVITGDLVDGPVAGLAGDVAPLADLQAPLGRFFVTGNHEYYSGAAEWVEHLEAMGFRVLLNRHVVLGEGTGRLVLAGVTDHDAGRILPEHRSDPAAALAGAPAGLPRILLAHQPRSAHAAQGLGIDLQISGHTHGGQIWPWMHLVRLQQPTVAGLDRVGDVRVYTSRGTGTWGPPLRLGAPPEITVIELVADEGAPAG